MGKKSIDETLSSDGRDMDAQAYFITAEADTHTQPSGLLKALVKVLTGPVSETEDDRKRQERLIELRRWWEEQLARQKEISRVGSSD